MRSPHACESDTSKPSPPVGRITLFRSELVEIRENRCLRTDPSITGPTEPLPFDEICIPRRGLWIRHLGRQELLVDVNHVHFFSHGEVHRVEHPGGCGDRNTGLILPRATLVEILQPLEPRLASRDDERIFPCDSLRMGPPEFALHRALVAAASVEGGADAMEVEEGCLRLVSRLLLRMQTPGPQPAADSPRHRDLAQAAKTLLAAHYDEPLSLADVATALQVSRFHLCRVFARVVGVSLHRYLVQLRLHAVLERILESGEPLEEVAAATGFANRSQLSRQFARAFGASPREMRGLDASKRIRLLLARLSAAID